MVCSDRLHTYSLLGVRRRQVCWAHLKRDFRSTAAARRDGWARTDGEVAAQLFASWRDFRQRALTRRHLQWRAAA